MAIDSGKLLLGLAAAVGTTLLVFARKYDPDFTLPLELQTEDAIARAQLELERWRGMTESDAAAAPVLARYWAAVGMPPQPPGVPWSAAFISFVAGPAGLSPSGDHVGYARAALAARKRGDRGRYWAFAPNESGLLPVRRGDILINWRNQPASWADVAADTGHKDAHGRLVTYAAPGLYSVIGGNEGNAVTQTDVPSSTGVPPSDVFAILRKPPLGGVA